MTRYTTALLFVEYGFVNIGGRPNLLPARSTDVSCVPGSDECARNVTDFRNYRGHP